MDTIKHSMIFDASPFQTRERESRVAIVGVGALGSALAIQIAKLGVTSMVLFDHDTIEDHNLPNQILYGPRDVGRPKVEAAAEAIERLTGYTPKVSSQRLERKAQLAERGTTHVFVCVDSMAARDSIFRSTVFMNPIVRFFCEGRMNSRDGEVATFDPSDTVKAKEYIARLYSDDEVVVERAACGTIPNIGATASMVAAQMTWQFINAHHVGGAKVFSEEIAFTVSDLAVHHKGMLVA